MKPLAIRGHLEAGEADQSDIEHAHDGGRPDEAASHPAVAGRQPLETGVEATEEFPCQTADAARFAAALVVGFQQHRAECGAQGQGDDDGDDRRGGDGRRELREEQAGDAANEGGGNEHRAQRQRDGDECRGDLVHRLVCGLARRHALRHVALDVLDHDDGVVDDDADRQDQAEHRQVVDRDAEGGEDREGAEQRYRDGDHGNDRRPPALQEHEDDADHQRDRDEDRLDHFVDGLTDEGRRVVDVDVVQTRRETLLQLRHLVPDRVLDLHDVRAGVAIGNHGADGYLSA